MLTHLYVFPWFFVDILLPPSLNRRTRWVQLEPAPTGTFRGPFELELDSRKLEHANVHNREISGALVHTQVLHLRGAPEPRIDGPTNIGQTERARDAILKHSSQY